MMNFGNSPLLDNFNSIKVRLERDFHLQTQTLTLQFQFHKGTIRTYCEQEY